MTELREPAGADAARLLYADSARRLSDLTRNLVPTDRDHTFGDYVHEALLVAREAERLAALAVVVERACGATWETIGESAGGITKQSAQRRWADVADAVEALASGLHRDALRARGAATSGQLAEDLDHWYARHRQPGDQADDVARPVSAYLLDPGPAPDLSRYDTSATEAYEWLLSDHPWARAERNRRVAANQDAELANAGDVRTWTDQTQGSDPQQRYPDNPAIAENLRALADLMRPIADEQQMRAHLDAADSDEHRVARLREQWITHRHVQGDNDYRYPVNLVGPGAAAYPPPPSGYSTARRDEENFDDPARDTDAHQTGDNR